MRIGKDLQLLNRRLAPLNRCTLTSSKGLCLIDSHVIHLQVPQAEHCLVQLFAVLF